MKSVWITGGTRGIGKATAELFCKNGFRTAVSFCSDRAAAEVFASEHPGIAVLQGDVSDASQVARMKEQIGHVDVLINNAGFASQKLFCEVSEEEWDRMFAVHVRGAFLCTRAVADEMIARHQGAIVNLASMWGQVGGSCEVAYSAAKGAVIAMTKALAKELGPSGITVNCVAPGVIDTEMCAHLGTEDREALCDETPLGRLGTAGEVAEAIYYLATASFVTGQVLSPNGGLVV